MMGGVLRTNKRLRRRPEGLLVLPPIYIDNSLHVMFSILIKSFCGGGQGGQFFQKAPPLVAEGKKI
jgi:hypothetical protein